MLCSVTASDSPVVNSDTCKTNLSDVFESAFSDMSPRNQERCFRSGHKPPDAIDPPGSASTALVGDFCLELQRDEGKRHEKIKSSPS